MLTFIRLAALLVAVASASAAAGLQLHSDGLHHNHHDHDHHHQHQQQQPNHQPNQRQKSATSAPLVVPLKNYKNEQYYGQVGVGSPPQLIPLQLDTSSANTWLLSANSCSAGATTKLRSLCDQHTHDRFNRSASSSAKCHSVAPDATAASLAANGTGVTPTGGLIGQLCVDQLWLGPVGQAANSLASSLTFLALEDVADESEMAGIKKHAGSLGLGFQRTDGGPQSSSLLAQVEAHFGRPIFSVYLRWNAPPVAPTTTDPKRADAHTADGGELVLGGLSECSLADDIHYVPVTHQERWQIKLDNVSFSDGTAHIECGGPRGCHATVETSFPFIGGPERAIDELNRRLNSTATLAGRYVIPCNKSGLPELVIGLGGRPFRISPDQYVIPDDQETCYSALSALDPQVDHWILGALFISSYYAVFDYGERRRIGFAWTDPNDANNNKYYHVAFWSMSILVLFVALTAAYLYRSWAGRRRGAQAASSASADDEPAERSSFIGGSQ